MFYSKLFYANDSSIKTFTCNIITLKNHLLISERNSIFYLPSRVVDISTSTVSVSTSLAANALKMVASFSVPLASRAFAVRPCSVKLSWSVCMSVYSPRPLKVYWKPSSVWKCGSPYDQPEVIMCVEYYLLCSKRYN